jgi:(2Fe-2S) ferredoxin
VVYPEQVWYGGVTVDDVEEIIQSHLIGGKPVERLLIPEGPPAPKPIGLGKRPG